MNPRAAAWVVFAVSAIAAAAALAAASANLLAGTPAGDLPVFAATLAITGWSGLAAGWAVQRWSAPWASPRASCSSRGSASPCLS